MHILVKIGILLHKMARVHFSLNTAVCNNAKHSFDQRKRKVCSRSKYFLVKRDVSIILVGVPLYRIYPRKSDWKIGGPIEPATDPDSGEQPGSTNAPSIVEKAAALAEKYRLAFHVQIF